MPTPGTGTVSRTTYSQKQLQEIGISINSGGQVNLEQKKKGSIPCSKPLNQITELKQSTHAISEVINAPINKDDKINVSATTFLAKGDSKSDYDTKRYKQYYGDGTAKGSETNKVEKQNKINGGMGSSMGMRPKSREADRKGSPFRNHT